MNVQIMKLQKELKIKDDAIKKAYIIIEAQMQQIQEFEKNNNSISDKKKSISTNENTEIFSIHQYKNELIRLQEYDEVFENLLLNQIKNQELQIQQNQLSLLDSEFFYWQNQNKSFQNSLEKAILIIEQIQQQNFELKQVINQLNIENKVVCQMIIQLSQTENFANIKLDMIDYLSSSSISSLNQSFQTFSGFISEIILIATNKNKLKEDQENQINLQLKKENQSLKQQIIQNDIFVQELINILNIENEYNQPSQQLLNIIKSIKQLKHKELFNTEDKENDKNYNNQYYNKFENLVNQFNIVFNQFIDKLNQNSDEIQIIQQFKNIIDSLIVEIQIKQVTSLKLLNGFNSFIRLLKNIISNKSKLAE